MELNLFRPKLMIQFDEFMNLFPHLKSAMGAGSQFKTRLNVNEIVSDFTQGLSKQFLGPAECFVFQFFFASVFPNILVKVLQTLALTCPFISTKGNQNQIKINPG